MYSAGAVFEFSPALLVLLVLVVCLAEVLSPLSSLSRCVVFCSLSLSRIAVQQGRRRRRKNIVLDAVVRQLYDDGDGMGSSHGRALFFKRESERSSSTKLLILLYILLLLLPYSRERESVAPYRNFLVLYTESHSLSLSLA